AEARLGEVLSKIKPKGNDLTSSGGRKVHLPDGIDKREAPKSGGVLHRARLRSSILRKRGEHFFDIFSILGLQ
ncbi:MAG: hypothetical protein JXN61_05415, partial [Sedimentisphaerales bacterium]|nr:hypothetical protein [Sedimentisphaerales bacterium]